MLRLSLCVVLVCVVGCESAAQRRVREAQESAVRTLADGRAAWKAGDHTEAIELFSKAIATCPSTAGYNERANAYALTDQDELAADDVEKGLAISPQHAGLTKVRSLLKKRRADRERQIAAARELERAEALRAQAERDRIARNRAMSEERERAAARQREQAAFDRGWSSLPSAIRLPLAVGEHTSLELPRVPQGQAGYELQLSGDPEFVLERQSTGYAWAVFHGKTPVGVFALNSTKLDFTWEQGLSQPDDSFRLCALQVGAAGRSSELDLRVPAKGPALDINFAKDVTLEALPITDTAAEELLLDFISIQGIQGEASPTRVKYNEPMHVVLVEATAAEAGVELTVKLIKKKDLPALEMRPYIIDTNTKRFPLSLKRLETMSKRVEHELPRQTNELLNLQGRFVAVQQMGNYMTAKLNQAPLPLLPTVPGFNSLDRLNPRDPAEKLKIQLLLDSIAQELVDLDKRIKNKALNVQRMTGQQQVLPKLLSIGATAHDSASLRLRVLKQSAGREIEIMTLDQDSPGSGSRDRPSSRFKKL